MTGGDETRREVPDSFSAAFGFPPVPRRILFAAMTMRTGGAETHILTLASELVRRGHSVTVASDGGELEDELRSAGVGVEHDSRSYVFVFHQCLDAVAGGFLVGGKQHPETDGFVHGISQRGQVDGHW